MTYNNYLCRTLDGGFFLARGTLLQEDSSLAIVKSWSEPVVTPRYSIIDVATGLFVLRGNSKKKLLELWEERKPNILNKIKDARDRNIYLERIIELNEEKRVWRTSGYEIK